LEITHAIASNVSFIRGFNRVEYGAGQAKRWPSAFDRLSPWEYRT